MRYDYFMTPTEYYRTKRQQNALCEDPAQESVVLTLEKLYTKLCREQKKRRWLSVLRPHQAVRGLYLWGSVGIGKTFLMDCLYNCVPFSQKLRLHFHQFMRLIHQSLKMNQGKKDPLRFIAAELAKNHLLICLDELIVSDIGDAMILGRLFEQLIAHGICLVVTSNLPPDELYKDGLQRQHFLPVIALLKKQLLVRYLATRRDYRLRHLEQGGIFYIPDDEIATDNMEKVFSLLTSQQPCSTADLEVHSRKISVKKQAAGVIWFDFKMLCAIPRSPQDYLVIAEKYHTVFLSNVPRLSARATDKISLFIQLIDILYDARIRLILSAETAVENLYTQGRLLTEYARTCSRLQEMQSENYFSEKNKL